LFINLPALSPLWRSVRGTYGVSRVVGTAEAPAPVPLGFVEHLIERTSVDGVLGFDDEFAPGDAVRVVGGSFDKVYGVLCSIEPDNRVTVLLDLLGRQVPVQISRRYLMACAE
jgi:transcriptional antiterminator RfaH